MALAGADLHLTKPDMAKRSAARSPVARELAALRNRDGKVVVATVHSWAQSHPNSAIAKELEWDDAVAGKAHRFGQIRRLIQIHIVDAVGTRKFVSLSIDRTEEGGGYRDVADVMRHKNLRAIMLTDALNDLDRLHKQYLPLTELQPIWNVVERLKRQLGDGDGQAAAD
jgi:hypothetical protein